jgi:hypothetical protein
MDDDDEPALPDQKRHGFRHALINPVENFDRANGIPTAETTPALPRYAVTFRPTSSLEPNARNPRTHTPKQIRQIADSIRVFGFNNPMLIDASNRVVAGHGRLKAARLLGLEEVPTIRLEHMTEAERRAYAIADNRLAELAGWDRDLLRAELSYIPELEIDFDLNLTGFETAEIDILMTPVGPEGAQDPFDECLPLPGGDPAVSQPGDLWHLGPHHLLCGDSTRAAAFEQVMGGQLAELVFTDPPYNVPIDGHVCGLGRTRHHEFAMGAGELSEVEFTTFLRTSFGHLVQHSRPGSIHFACMDWRHSSELLTAARGLYAEVKNLCVWVKTNAGMGSLYRSQHELVFVLKNGTAPHINNVELGRLGRYRTNVWTYPGLNSWGPGREEALASHPTVKPVALVADAIRDCSKRGGLVLDPFAGSGTTLLAAERTRRRACTIEIDPRYVDIAILRFQKATGQTAVHAASGLTFEALQHRRRQGACPADPDQLPCGGAKA